jgi:hypothetical protein
VPQPLTKVIDHFDMETNRGKGISVRQQILNERDKNYGKVVSRYLLSGKSALEVFLDPGNTRNMLIFQHVPILPFPPKSRQKQAKQLFHQNFTFS